MKKLIKGTSLILSTVIFGSIVSPMMLKSSMIQAQSTEKVSKTVSTSINGIDLNNPILTGSNSETLTPAQIQEVQSKTNAILDNINDVSKDFNDPAYAQNITSNIEKRGKAGIAAKAAAKLIKAGLKKMGKKGYTKLAKTTGLQAIGLNWTVITKTADVLAGFSGKVETGLTKALRKAGVSKGLAGVAARLISTFLL